MTPQERDLILGLFQRLKPPPEGDIDGEARELIDGLVRQQPLAPYLLAQTALVQEYALKGAQARIANLEAKLAQASSARRAGSAAAKLPFGPARRRSAGAPGLSLRPRLLHRKLPPLRRRGPGAREEAPASCNRRFPRRRAWPAARSSFRASSICSAMAAAPLPCGRRASPSRRKTSLSIISSRHPRMWPATRSRQRSDPSIRPRSMIPASTRAATVSATTADSRTSEEAARLSERSRPQPRPTRGIFVAITVRNKALASAGRSAMNSTARATLETSITGSTASVPLA